MKKIFAIVIGILLFLGALFVVFQNKAVPTLSVVRTVPAAEESHNPFSPVIIYFNRPPKEKELSFSINPQTETTLSISSESGVILTPKTTFSPLTVYQVTVYTSPPFTFRFETEQAENNTPGWNALFDAAEDQYTKTYGSQDEALAQIRASSPIKETGFYIEYSYKNNTYTVTLSAPYESNKSAFLNWIKQKGVTDLTTVRIVYINK